MMTAVAPQNRGDNLGRYAQWRLQRTVNPSRWIHRRFDSYSAHHKSRYSSVLAERFLGVEEAAGSSPAISTTVVSTAITSMFRCKSGPGNQYVSPWDIKITEETTSSSPLGCRLYGDIRKYKSNPDLQVCGLRGELSKSDEMLTRWQETMGNICPYQRYPTGEAESKSSRTRLASNFMPE